MSNPYVFDAKSLAIIGEKNLDKIVIENKNMGYLYLEKDSDEALFLKYFDSKQQKIVTYKYKIEKGLSGEELYQFEKGRFCYFKTLMEKISQQFRIGLVKNFVEDSFSKEENKISDGQLQQGVKKLSDNTLPKGYFQKLFGVPMNFYNMHAGDIECAWVVDKKFILIWQPQYDGSYGEGAIVTPEFFQKILNFEMKDFAASSSPTSILSRLESNSPSLTSSKIILSRFYFHTDRLEEKGLPCERLDKFVLQNEHLAYFRNVDGNATNLYLVTAKKGELGQIVETKYATFIKDRKIHIESKDGYVSIEKFVADARYGKKLGIIKNCINDYVKSGNHINREESSKIEGIFYSLKNPQLKSEINQILNFEINTLSEYDVKCEPIEGTDFYLLWQWQAAAGGDGAIVSVTQLREILEVCDRYEARHKPVMPVVKQESKKGDAEIEALMESFQIL